MKAFILAAGEGRRMLPLTAHTPKPLLKVGGVSLLAQQLKRLKAAGFREVVINVYYLGEQIISAIGDGSTWGLKIRYSVESQALETGGGIKLALPLLGKQPFAVINGDIWCDYDLHNIRQHQLRDNLAHLVLVDNPSQHPYGDFTLSGDQLSPLPTKTSPHGLTYSGISLLHPALFDGSPQGRFRWPDLLPALMQRKRVSAEHYSGLWVDVGTPERLDFLRHQQPG